MFYRVLPCDNIVSFFAAFSTRASRSMSLKVVVVLVLVVVVVLLVTYSK